jgi:glucan endo-1,3-alpha-glucosidase
MLWFSKDPTAPLSSSSSSSQPTSTPLLPSGWFHVERLQDRDGSNRLLPAYMFNAVTMTPTQCVDACGAKGFKIAGVEDATECWCDNEFNTKAGEVQTVECGEDECGKPCPGDHQQRCGDGWVMDVYRFGPLSKKRSLALETRDESDSDSSVLNWVAGPCMSDQDPVRLLSSLELTSKLLSHQQCFDLCSSLNLDIAGLQNGDECWCGDVLNLARDERPSGREIDQGDCKEPCGGAADPAEMCGGPLRMLLFSRNKSLEKYIFGFTRDGESLTEVALSPSGPGVNPEITDPALGQDGVVTDVVGDPLEVIKEPFDLANELLPQGPLSSLTPITGIDPSNLNPNTGSESITAKKVLAHHMVGNTYPYTLNTWVSDVKLAKATGIDAFVLNFGEGGYGGWQRARMRDAFKAAEMVGGFGMVFSFDMS